MATKETLKARAKIAAQFSLLMRDPKFFARAEKVIPKDSDGEFTVIIAASFESAALTIHRMEQVGESEATLVTDLDDMLDITSFQGRRGNGIAADTVDVPGGMTVREWLEMVKENKHRAFGAHGSEFAAELSNLSLAQV